MIAHAPVVAQLLVRNLEDDLVRELKRRAGEHGVSVEEEHRRILKQALFEQGKHQKTFWQALSEMPEDGDDFLFDRDRNNPGRASDQQIVSD